MILPTFAMGSKVTSVECVSKSWSVMGLDASVTVVVLEEGP